MDGSRNLVTLTYFLNSIVMAHVFLLLIQIIAIQVRPLLYILIPDFSSGSKDGVVSLSCYLTNQLLFGMLIETFSISRFILPRFRIEEKLMAAQRGLWGWLFQRVTGVYLVFGLIVHVIVTHFVTRSVTFEWVSERLHSGWWLAFDLSLLFVSFYHGFNGLWGIVLDFNPSRKWRVGIGWGLFALAVGWVVYGIFVLIPFVQ
ncbi:MAG: hypothetical protein C4520_07740 [Candidatus Abyssobacteria bacterium SURF_5]|uniref:Succinate dehydrogenase hydrophobic membrane anchor subunit n=1 Tax=Abyssobacteria bacterium (strain SURF_5) TaxID=2093360 RepID=A0A3A4P4F1_ABYX5|nr:MAG: hypothetical protein C4520_07740 [Candidatus Abyssubacteria bacterium SURF_5]